MEISKKLILRVDGNTKIGLGHVYRCIAIAEMLDEDIDCEFLLGYQSQFQNVIPEKFPVKNIPQEILPPDEVKWMSENYSSNNTVVILDGYHFSSAYQKQLKDCFYPFIYIDDLANDHMYANAVINHSPQANSENYIKEEYTKLFLGLDYVLLRKSFLNEAKNSTAGVSTIKKALISLGGSDEHNITLKILNALLDIEVLIEVNIIIGAAYRHKECLLEVVNTSAKKINLFSNLKETEVLELMRETDIAVAPCSTTCLELMAVKKPLFVGYSADNQKELYNYLRSHKLIFDLHDLLKTSQVEVRDIVLNVIKNKQLIYDMMLAQEKLIDGNSDKRIRRIVNELI